MGEEKTCYSSNLKTQKNIAHSLQYVDVQQTTFSDLAIGRFSLSTCSANISKIFKRIPAKGVLNEINL